MLNHRYQEEQYLRKFFAQRLRSARKAANLSQKGLAYRLQIGQDTISNYERRRVIPSVLILFQLAQALSVNVGYFFPEEPYSVLSDCG